MNRLLSPSTISLSSLIEEIDQFQSLTTEQIQDYQLQQLFNLLNYHDRHNSFYSNFLKKSKVKVRSHLDLRVLPILKRRDIQIIGENFFTKKIPADHTPISEVQTSGSTGEPVKINKTQINSKFWAAYTIRDHIWNNRNFESKLSSIRPTIDEYIEMDSWGNPASSLYKTGEGQGIPITTDIKKQLHLLKQFSTEILIVYPNNLKGLISTMKDDSVCLPSVKHIKTVGETVNDALRKETKEIFGLSIEDNYSSQELGTIAIQCPSSGLYHVMSESVILEVLNDVGQPCIEGEIGRVVVTDLHNFASPLIRYDIGDYAEVGGRCNCGRNLPTIKCIVGRERNLIIKPDGSKHWPIFGFHQFDKIVPVHQYQFVQHSLTQIEMRVFPKRKLTDLDKENLARIVKIFLDAPFVVDIVEFNDVIPSKAHKFEEFVSLCV